MSAQPVIDYYLSPVSPWTYLAASRFRKLAGKHNANVNIYLIDLGKVFPVSGGLPLPKRAPQRQAYRLQEMVRFSRYLGQPLITQPDHFPPSSGLAGPVMAAARTNLPVTDALRASEAIMARLWAHDEDIGESGVLAAALTEAGFDGTALVADAQANADDYAAAIASDTDWAIAANVFGAPTFVVDGEVFWGQDRLDLLDWHLSNI
jgi:2-hydroxychromene-2-carboxylate isomerase